MNDVIDARNVVSRHGQDDSTTGYVIFHVVRVAIDGCVERPTLPLKERPVHGSVTPVARGLVPSVSQSFVCGLVVELEGNANGTQDTIPRIPFEACR